MLSGKDGVSRRSNRKTRAPLQGPRETIVPSIRWPPSQQSYLATSRQEFHSPPSPAAAAAEQSTGIRASSISALEFEQVDAFHVQRLPVARNQDDNSQPHGRFRRRHHNHKQHKNLPIDFSQRLAERHERQIDRVQHQFDGHENRDDVALENKRKHTQSEQDRAQDHVIIRRHHLRFSPAAPAPRPRAPLRESGTTSARTDKQSP